MMTRNKWNVDRNAWIAWTVLFLIMAGIIVSGSHRTVVPSYRQSAMDWFAGRQLYDGTGVGGFVYFPHAAILFMPLTWLPPLLGEVIWRLVNIGTLALGFHSFARLAAEKSREEIFPMMTLVAIPLTWDCARNGQATLALTGLMLLAVVDVARDRWWRATLWLCLGIALKPLMLVLALLIGAIVRPMTWRTLVGMAVLALSPFLFQHPFYVLQQYSGCWQNTTAAAHVGVAVQGWTSPFVSLRLAGIDVPERGQTAIRIVAAVITWMLSVLVRRRYDAARSAVFVFSMAAVYLMLFSPRTENNTYAMLGPAFAVFVARAFLIERRFAEGIVLTGVALVTAGSRTVGHLIAPGTEAIWLAPVLAAFFAVYLLVRIFERPPNPVEAR
ncbi:MAG: hypothetical protein A2107_10515 [Verrucomicrobia bacterium GWF2_62_7]|nr:MAG: hypothetical protein A2107_10515 [Verrucomicrobia bacterium GWF2_62_7]